MKRLCWVVLAATVIGSSCSYGDSPDEAAPRDRSFGDGTVLIETDEDTVLLDVEVAQTDEQRARGLMGRRFLPEDAGMVFIFFDRTRGGFWMKNTRIPLSIAFFDHDGKIIEILDMDPCRKEPCEIYSPDERYWGALEVNQGAFEEWGVEEGDVIESNQ